MAQDAKSVLPSSYAGRGGLLVGGLLAGLAVPRLWSVGRKAVRRMVGITYRDQPLTSGPTSADPARGRPA
jgi:hypothetical protein